MKLLSKEWLVEDLSIDAAWSLVARLHYARGAANTATYLHGLFKRGDPTPYGVAWWIPPTKNAALATYPENWKGVLALSRLVIAPDVPSNACTFLLARSRKAIDPLLWPCLVTYADEWRGHTGAIYRADNWTYCGLTTTPTPTYTINGVMTARKAGPKTRTHAEMLALGATVEGEHRKHKFVMIRKPPKNQARRLLFPLSGGLCT